MVQVTNFGQVLCYAYLADECLLRSCSHCLAMGILTLHQLMTTANLCWPATGMCPATTIASTNFVNVYCLLSRLRLQLSLVLVGVVLLQ